jgi:hypothetical protein
VRQDDEKEDAMRTKLALFTPMLGAAAVAAAILAAPIASAAPSTQAPAPQQHQSCAGSGSATVCQSPGNVQINDAPPPVQFYPYGGLGFLI